MEKSRKAEAFRTLAALRDSEIRYQAMNGTFAGSLNSLDFDPNATQGGQNRFFSYSISAANNSGFIASAQRMGRASYTIQINQAGLVRGGNGIVLAVAMSVGEPKPISSKN